MEKVSIIPVSQPCYAIAKSKEEPHLLWDTKTETFASNSYSFWATLKTAEDKLESAQAKSTKATVITCNMVPTVFLDKLKENKPNRTNIVQANNLNISNLYNNKAFGKPIPAPAAT